MAEAPSTAYNATVDLLERNLPGGSGRPYLVTRERTRSYGEVAEGAYAAGAGMLALGLAVGDRVVLATRDRPEFVMAFWGAVKAGLVPIPVAQGLSTSDIHFVLADSEARLAICDGSSIPAVLPAAQAAGVTAVVVGGRRREDGARPWDEVLAGPAPLAPAPTAEDDIALWLYTSGTTGLPKAAMHRHRNLRAAPGALAAQVVRMAPDDVILSASKMFFAYGLGNSVYLPAAAGASVVVDEGPIIPARLQGLLELAHPTVLFGVPSLFAGYAGLAEAELPPSVRVVLSAGEALPVDLFDGFRRRFGLPLLDGLGATEALHHVTSNRVDDVVPGSAGRPLDGYEARALDSDHQPVPDGENGELWVRGPTTFAGYWKRPELTDRVYRDGWLRTGDLVRFLDGRIYHQGRLDDLMKLGGMWVAPREIEETIRMHPDVRDAAVVATGEETGVPVLKAFVIADREDGELSRELTRLCRERLAAFKVPRSFEVVDELPRTATGKLRRFVLRGGRPAG